MEYTISKGHIIDRPDKDEFLYSSIDEGFNSFGQRTGPLENIEDYEYPVTIVVPEEEVQHNAQGEIEFGFRGIDYKVDCACETCNEYLYLISSIEESTDGCTSPTPAMFQLPLVTPIPLTSVEPLATAKPLAIAEPLATPPPTQPKEETAQDQGDRVIVPVYSNILSDRAVENALASVRPSYLSKLGEPHNPIVYVPSKSCFSTGEPAIFITGKEERENARVVKELYSDEMETFPSDYYQTDWYPPDNEIMSPLHNRSFVTNDRDCPAIDIVTDEDIFTKDSSKDILLSSAALDDSSIQSEIPSVSGVGMPQWEWP